MNNNKDTLIRSVMSSEKTLWPQGMFSRETWENSSLRDCKAMHSSRSVAVAFSETADKRKCWYGLRSFSESPDVSEMEQRLSESKEKLDTSQSSMASISDTDTDEVKRGNTEANEKSTTQLCEAIESDSDTSSERHSIHNRIESLGQLGDEGDPFSYHMYENIWIDKAKNESNSSCSTGKSSFYSIEDCTVEFENSECMAAQTCRKKSSSPEASCAYSIPRCNCVLKKKTALPDKKRIGAEMTSGYTVNKMITASMDKDSSGYICMNSYIDMNTNQQCHKKETFHIYENDKTWIGEKRIFDDRDHEDYVTPDNSNFDDYIVPCDGAVVETLNDKQQRKPFHYEPEPGENRHETFKAQSLRRKSRRKNRPSLDHELLEATLAQQVVDNLTDTIADSINDFSTLKDVIDYEATDTEQIGMGSLQRQHSKRTVYLPNVHPKLIRFLMSIPFHRRRLEDEMARKDLAVLWPRNEYGILALQTISKPSTAIRQSQTSNDDKVTNAFQTYIRKTKVDDSICIAKEIAEDLSTFLKIAPLVTKCAVYNEHMNFIIIGEKSSVEECKRQLQALINFLELRRKASKDYNSTKTKYMARHEIRLVFESKILDKLRSQNGGLHIDVCDNFEYIQFRGEMSAVDNAMGEFQTYLRKVQGSVYKCSKMVRCLLNCAEVKAHLQELLRNQGLLCAWRATENTCIIYGTSEGDRQSVKDLFRKILVSRTINLSQGQKELLQSRLGRTEIKVMKKNYQGCLEVEISGSSLQFTCIQRVQGDICKRLQKFLYKHEVIKTAQEVDFGIFQYLQRFSWDKVVDLKKRCKDILVEMSWFEEKPKCGFVLSGKRDFCKIASTMLEKMLNKVTRFEYSIKGVGLSSFLQSDSGRAQMSDLEAKYQCVLHFPDGSAITQNKVCFCQYGDKEIVVLQDDISSVSAELAYIPCSPSSEEMKSKVEGEMPRKLVARECMISPDTKHTNKSNFFACLPEKDFWDSEVVDALKSSVTLCLREAKKQNISSVAFSTCTSIKDFPSAEYSQVLVETIKSFLDTEGRSTMLQTVVFCAQYGSDISSFIQTLKCVLGCKNMEMNGNAGWKATPLTNEKVSEVYSTAAEIKELQLEEDERLSVDVQLVKEDLISIKADAVFIPTNAALDLPSSILRLTSSTVENIREEIENNYIYGLATGQIVSLVNDDFCDLIYIANVGPDTTQDDSESNILKTVVRQVLERCIVDEIEVLAVASFDSGIYLLAEVIFDALQHFIGQNLILERVVIMVEHQDKSSYLPFEANKKLFCERVSSNGSQEFSQLGGIKPESAAAEKSEKLSFTEESVVVEISLGDITEETTDVIVNSVRGDLDLTTGRLAKAVSEAAGSDLQTQLKTRDNQSKLRRDGLVMTGPGDLQCRYIFHVKVKSSTEGWKAVISSSLQQAETLGIESIAFPALGTGKKGIKPHYFTKSILKCIRKFAKTNPKSLHHVRIIVFEDTMLHTILQSVSAFRSRKKRHTLKDRIYEMLKKDSPKQTEEEVRLYVYTAVDNVETLKRQLDRVGDKTPLLETRSGIM